jgi:hypothetical protein
VLAPEAVNVVVCPEHIVFVPLTLTVGVVFTVTVIVLTAAEQPLVAPVTV